MVGIFSFHLPSPFLNVKEKDNCWTDCAVLDNHTETLMVIITLGDLDTYTIQGVLIIEDGLILFMLTISKVFYNDWDVQCSKKYYK